MLTDSNKILGGQEKMEKIRDIMTDKVESCTLLDNVFEVAVKMKELNVGPSRLLIRIN